MPVYDMKCPRCGKQSTEYDENKWQCLHCGNKFVYKEESTTYQSQTNVNIQGSSLFDVEPFDPADKLRMEEREPTLSEPLSTALRGPEAVALPAVLPEEAERKTMTTTMMTTLKRRS